MSGAGDPVRAPVPAPVRAPALDIALVHYAAPPVIGGVERVLARHAVLLADAGHRVRVVAGRGRSPDPRVRFEHLPLLDPRHPVIERLQRSLDAGSVPPDFDQVTAAIAGELRQTINGSDLVIAHNVCSLGLNLALTAAMRRVMDRPGAPRLILWHHDLAWTSPQYRASLHDGPPWDLLRSAWPGATQVVVSAGRRAELARLTGVAPGTIEVIPNGVDLRRTWKVSRRTTELIARLDALHLEPLILVPARITRRKNVELALRVVGALRAAGRPAGLLVTGPADPHHGSGGAYLEELRRLREELGLEGCAWFLSEELGGPPSDPVMADLYRLADLLFLPSRDEGFGLPILEAAVNRLPIVCSDLPTLRELAGDGALYIDPDGDPGEIAGRMLRLLDADAVGRLAREVRSTYDWDAVYRERIAPLLAADRAG